MSARRAHLRTKRGSQWPTGPRFDHNCARLFEHLDRKLGSLARVFGHGRKRHAEHARDTTDAVVERHGAHAHLHDGQQLVHELRRRRDLNGVAGSAHHLASQLVHEVKVHGFSCQALVDDIFDSTKDRVRGVAIDDGLADRLQALKPGDALVEKICGRLQVVGNLGLGWQLLIEDDERRGRVHLGRLEDAFE